MASPTSVKLDDDLKARLQRVAAAERRSSHWIIREAVAHYVAQKEDDLAADAEAEAAWQDYKLTGLHVTGEEMEAWLEARIRGENPKMPEPHL